MTLLPQFLDLLSHIFKLTSQYVYFLEKISLGLLATLLSHTAC